jgi:hypothetical protein
VAGPIAKGWLGNLGELDLRHSREIWFGYVGIDPPDRWDLVHRAEDVVVFFPSSSSSAGTRPMTSDVDVDSVPGRDMAAAAW